MCICILLSVAITAVLETSKTHVVIENQKRNELLQFEYANVLTKAYTSTGTKLGPLSVPTQLDQVSEASHSQ